MKKNASVEKSVWWTHDRKDALKGYVLILPAILLLTVFTIYPIFYLIDSSLRDGSLLSKKRGFVGLENFIMLFKSVDFHTTLKNTFIYSIGLVAILMVLATLFAVWVNGKAQKHLNSVTLAAVFTPHIISLVSVSTVFLWIMDPQIGAVNYVLRSLGLKPFPFLASSKTALASLIGMMVWKSLGYYALLILAALQGVSKDIYEAAKVDGASTPKAIIYVILPMLKPILIFQITNGMIGCLKIFEEPLMLFGDYKGGVNSAAQTMNMKFLDTAFKAGQSGYGAATGYLMFVIILIFTMVYFRIVNREET